MSNTFKENIDSNRYFQTLPTYVQETIKQSGIDINSEEELRKCAEKLMKNDQLKAARGIVRRFFYLIKPEGGALYRAPPSGNRFIYFALHQELVTHNRHFCDDKQH